MKRAITGLALALAALVFLSGCSTWPDDPITSGKVTDLYYVPADDGGPRWVGGRPAGTRDATPAAYSVIVKSDEGACRLSLSEELYNGLAVGDEITMEPCGLILTVNGEPR